MAVFSIPGCSDSPSDTGDNATVTMKGELTSSAVTAALLKDESSTILSGGAEVDSLKVTRVRILLSQVKMHVSKDDTVIGDKVVKTGPVMMTIDSAGARTFTTATIPAGTYDKVKFEFHRFSSSEVAGYLSDTVYQDFVTDDRWTFIIDGFLYKDGVRTGFTYRSDATANLTLKFEPEITLTAGSSAAIVIAVDPAAVFKKGAAVLDPRDKQNESEIDNAIKAAVKALKR
jgi:hypothetical protein